MLSASFAGISWPGSLNISRVPLVSVLFTSATKVYDKNMTCAKVMAHFVFLKQGTEKKKESGLKNSVH